MSLFVSNAKEILNIGKDATGLLAGFDDNIIEEVLNFIREDDISAQLETLSGDDRNKIKDFFGTLIKKVGGDEVVKMLRTPVGEIPAEGFGWTWKDDLSHEVPLSGSVTLTLGASAAAEAKILPKPSYFFRGEVGVSGSVTVPFSYGAFTVRGGAKGSATVQATFEHDPATRVLTALANDLPTVAKLVDPEQLLQNEQFTSASLNLQGEVNLGASVSAGRSWVAALGNREDSPAANVDLSATYSIDWAHNGQFEVAIARTDNSHCLDITVTQVDKESLKRALSVGANVKFSNVSNALQPVMNQLKDLPGPLRELVQKYSQPSELVRGFLETQLSPTDDRIQKIVEMIPDDKSADSFVNDLVTEALEFVAGHVDRWTTLANGEVESLTPSILDRLNIPTNVRSDLETFLNEKLREASDDLGNKIQSALGGALRGGAGTEIVNFLDALDLHPPTLDDVDSWAAELLNPVNKLLEKYRTFERKLVNAVEVAEKNALVLQFTREVTKSEEHTSLLKFTLDLAADRDKAEEIYQRMLVGDFSKAMIDGQNNDLKYITLVNGLFKSVFERKATTGINVNFFGMELSFQHILSSSLTVQNSVGGDIQIFKAEGGVRDRSIAFGEKEETQISSSLSLVGPENAPDAQGLSVGLLYDDEDLTPKEMRNYLESFAAVGLLTEGSTDYFSDEKSKIGITDDDGNRALRMQTQMSFTRSEIEAMARIDKEIIKKTAISKQLDAMYQVPTMRDALRGLFGLDVRLDPSDSRHYRLLTEPADDLIRSQLRNLGIRPRRSNVAMNLLHFIRRNAEDIVTFLECWQTLVNMPLPPLENGKLKADKVAEFEEKNAEMIKALDQWAGVAGFIRRELDEAHVSPMALAFLKVLRALSGREEEKLPIVISWDQDGRVRRLAVI